MQLSWFTKRSLGRRIVAFMILGNVVLSCMATAIQLFASYERGKDEVLTSLEVIDEGFKNSLSVALWKFDFQQANILIDGIKAKSDVLYLKLDATDGKQWQRGDASLPADVEHVLPLSYEPRNGDAKPVGVLKVGLTFQNLRDRLWDQLATLVVSNFVKTLLASMLMLLIFDRLVARHLRHLSGRLETRFMLDEQPEVKLDRTPSADRDELEQIAIALNTAKSQTHAAHRALARVNADLEDANREQSEFTYAISHDLKSPMNTLQMLLDELEQSEGPKLGADGVELIQDAQLTATRMRRLIDDVLSYARTIGKTTEFEPVDLAQVVEDVLRDLNGDVTDSAAKISIGHLPVLDASPVQMRMLFQNLISNALKFSKPDAAPDIAIDTILTSTGDTVEISVADQGIGIAPEFQSQIFGMFQKLHAEKRYPGSGLGLTLCNRIVSNHGGVLNVKSSSGVGATFTIILPREHR